MNGRGEQVLNRCVGTGKRHYGRKGMKKIVNELGKGPVLLMSNYILGYHALVSKGFLSTRLGDTGRGLQRVFY